VKGRRDVPRDGVVDVLCRDKREWKEGSEDLIRKGGGGEGGNARRSLGRGGGDGDCKGAGREGRVGRCGRV